MKWAAIARGGGMKWATGAAARAVKWAAIARGRRMNRALLLIPMAVLVGLPLTIRLAAPIGQLAVLAALAYAAGTLMRSVTLVAIGSAFALLAYALALPLAASPFDPLRATIFGIALLLVTEGIGFAHRFQDVTVHPSAMRAQIRYWVGISVAGAIAVAALDLIAGAFVFPAPRPVYVAVTALGAVGTVLGIVWLIRMRTT
jgi:hypothetical protein